MNAKAVFLLLLLPFNFAIGQSDTMNGIHFSDFKEFDKNWALVTVRYREDTQEMRFTYGNKAAIETLEKNSTDYPDGAVFGKFGILTEKDPLFASSIVPSGTRRMQLMVRDKKKYASTGGWGYAIFYGEGKTIPDMSGKKAVQACYACHKVAGSRGEVFSQIANFRTVKFPTATTPKFLETIKFAEVDVSSLPPAVKKAIPTSFKKVQRMQSEISKAIFLGTFDEIQPIMLRTASEKNMPALLLTDDGREFNVVFPNPDTAAKKCDTGKRSFFSISATLMDASSRVMTGVPTSICY